jgi:hypothetical protein
LIYIISHDLLYNLLPPYPTIIINLDI